MLTNTCSICNITNTLPNSEWRGVKKGIRIIHKTCYYKEYAINNKKTIAENKIRWIKKDPIRFKLTQKRYVDSGKAQESLQKRKAKNPIEFRKAAIARANKAKGSNPDRYLAYQAMYQRTRRDIISKPINTKFFDLLLIKYLHCPSDLTVDHIIPLKNDIVSGLHVPWNIQYLTQSHNSIKSNSFDGTYNNDGWRKYV